MSWETISRNLALCGPEVFWPLLIVPSGNVEKGVEYQDEALSVNCKESQPVNPFGVAARETAEKLVGGTTNIIKVPGGEVCGGMRVATRGLNSLIAARPCRPLLR